jgi:hypothetical protein
MNFTLTRCIVLISAIVGAMCSGCTKRDSRNPDSEKMYTIDVQRPDILASKHFCDVVERKISGDAGEGVRDFETENCLVNIVSGTIALDLRCEFIGADQYAADRFSLDVHTRPLSLRDALVKAHELYELLEASDDQLVEWYESRKYADPLTRRFSQRIEKFEIAHLVQIRPSFEKDKPWFLLYTLYWSRKSERKEK